MVARWLEQVRAQIPESQGDELTKLTEGAFVGFVSALGGVFQKNQVLEATDAKPAQDLEEGIRFARSESELGRLVEEIQAGFEAGHLAQDQAVRLAALTLDTARQLARGLVNVPMGTAV